MDAIKGIVWFLGILASINLIFVFIGIRAMCAFFPDGKRWWHFPIQIASLVIFAVIILNHPF